MVRTAIVEDNVDDIRLLKSHLQRFHAETGEAFSVTCYQDPASFLAEYGDKYDLVLMDVDMPGMSGFDCARCLREIDSSVTLIFITRLARYALSGYEVNALDFILKPVGYPMLAMKLKRAVNTIQKTRERHLNLSIKGGFVRIAVSQVFYLEVQRHYITYHTQRGDFVVRETLKAAEEKLAGCHFARTSVSHLVNLRHADFITNGCIHMKDSDIYISRSCKTQFMKALADYIGGNI